MKRTIIAAATLALLFAAGIAKAGDDEKSLFPRPDGFDMCMIVCMAVSTDEDFEIPEGAASLVTGYEQRVGECTNNCALFSGYGEK